MCVSIITNTRPCVRVARSPHRGRCGADSALLIWVRADSSASARPDARKIDTPGACSAESTEMDALERDVISRMVEPPLPTGKEGVVIACQKNRHRAYRRLPSPRTDAAHTQGGYLAAQLVDGGVGGACRPRRPRARPPREGGPGRERAAERTRGQLGEHAEREGPRDAALRLGVAEGRRPQLALNLLRLRRRRRLAVVKTGEKVTREAANERV